MLVKMHLKSTWLRNFRVDDIFGRSTKLLFTRLRVLFTSVHLQNCSPAKDFSNKEVMQVEEEHVGSTQWDLTFLSFFQLNEVLNFVGMRKHDFACAKHLSQEIDLIWRFFCGLGTCKTSPPQCP